MPSEDEIYQAAQKSFAEADAEKDVVGKLFDVNALAESTRQLRTLTDPVLGVVQYKLLTDLEVRNLEMPQNKTLDSVVSALIFAMLKKANCSFTIENFESLPRGAKARLAQLLESEVTKYFMGKTIDTCKDGQSLGIETLRNLYSSAGLTIRPKTQANRIDQLKEIIRAWG